MLENAFGQVQKNCFCGFELWGHVSGSVVKSLNRDEFPPAPGIQLASHVTAAASPLRFHKSKLVLEPTVCSKHQQVDPGQVANLQTLTVVY